MISCLFLFLDDIWYYKFHRTNYPSALILFMERVDIFYFFRVNLWLLDKINLVEDISIYN